MGAFTDIKVHDWLADLAASSWVSLHYESPAVGGTGLGEISGGGYLRQPVVFSTPTNRAIWNLDDVLFSGLLANRLTHFGIWTDAVNGDLAAYGELPEDTTVLNGHGYTIFAGQLALSIG